MIRAINTNRKIYSRSTVSLNLIMSPNLRSKYAYLLTDSISLHNYLTNADHYFLALLKLQLLSPKLLMSEFTVP